MGEFRWAGGRLWVYEGDPPKDKPRLDRVPVPAVKKSTPDIIPGLEWRISGKDGVWNVLERKGGKRIYIWGVHRHVP